MSQVGATYHHTSKARSLTHCWSWFLLRLVSNVISGQPTITTERGWESDTLPVFLLLVGNVNDWSNLSSHLLKLRICLFTWLTFLLLLFSNGISEQPTITTKRGWESDPLPVFLLLVGNVNDWSNLPSHLVKLRICLLTWLTFLLLLVDSVISTPPTITPSHARSLTHCLSSLLLVGNDNRSNRPSYLAKLRI
jgi:hypothetical protein